MARNLNTNFLFSFIASFRLWLTTASTARFPRNPIQNGIKLVYEQPKGFQNNLRQSYKSQTISSSSFYEGCAGKDKPFQRFIYSLCFFDAILHERKHYGNLGWNVRYNFNECDLQLSLQQLQRYMNESEHTPYAVLKYLIGECNYGGHVTDESDQRLLRTILEDFVNASVVENPLHKFGASEAFILPRRLEYREIVRYIDDVIPSEPPCELFGLHANADYVHLLDRSKKLLDSMAIAANMIRSPTLDESEAELCLQLNDIVNKLPKLVEMHGRRQSADIMDTVLQQEISTYNTFAEVIRDSCLQVTQAIQGTNPTRNQLRPYFSIVIFVLNFRIAGSHR